MKRSGVFLLLLVSIFLMASCAHRVLVSPVVDFSQYQRMAVLPFDSNTTFSNAGSELADGIVVQLIQNAPAVTVVERAKIDQVLQEQNLAASGILDPSTTVKLHQLLGINLLLTGNFKVAIGDTVAPLSYSNGASGSLTPQDIYTTRLVKGTAVARLIDVTTGKVIWAKQFEADTSTYAISSSGQLVASGTRTDGELVDDVANTIALHIAQCFWEHEEYQW